MRQSSMASLSVFGFALGIAFLCSPQALDEQADGFDTVEWAATLPYSDGKVGMMGGSYVGATQMLAAIAQPPHLAGIAPNVTASNYHENWTYQGGAFEQWFDQNWTSQLAQN